MEDEWGKLLEYEMPQEAYDNWMDIISSFENRQIENKFIKKLQELVFRKDISDAAFRKFVMNFVQVGGLE